MRLSLLSAGLATLCLMLPTPSIAQASSDCGLLCNLTGYLSSDHMAAQSDGASTPSGSSKPHRAHASNHKTPVAPATQTAVAAPRKPADKAAQVAARPSSSAQSAETPRLAAAATPAARVRPAAAQAPAAPSPKVFAKKISHPAQVQVATVVTPTVAPAPTRHAKVARAEATASGRILKAAAPSRLTSETQTAWALIPGSAPTMAAGFQPFGTWNFH